MILRALFFVVCIASLSWGNWPQFRGPNNDGWAGEQCHSLADNFSEDQNIVWKTPIHDKGWSTPVIWGKQVWMTTATTDGHKLYAVCVDRNTGAVVYDQVIFSIEKPSPLGNDVNTYASPSPVIEEGRVYVHFGSAGTACIDTATFKTLWERQDLPCNHFRGPASSPVLFDDKLILTFDGADLQYQAALDKQTGKTVWKTDRKSNFQDLDENGKPKTDGDYRKAFSTPIIFRVDDKPCMVISCSYDAFGYDPKSGKELWRIDHTCYSNASMALFGQGLIYLITGRGKQEMLAVKPGGSGNITDTHVQWRFGKGVPTMPSPVLVDGLIYFVDNNGVITCIEAKTGTLVWKDRLKGQYYSSPIFADNKLLFSNTAGEVTILKPGRALNIVNVNRLQDGFMSSPAVCDNELYLRSTTTLYRIESKK